MKKTYSTPLVTASDVVDATLSGSIKLTNFELPPSYFTVAGLGYGL